MKDLRTINYKRHVSRAFLKFEANPFEVGLSMALVIFGVRVLFGGLKVTPGSVQELPLWLAFIYCMLATLGGLSVVTGIFLSKRLGWAYGLERFGLFVSASAWGSYIIGLLLSPITAKSTLLILALSFLVVGCLMRARAISRNASATLVALRFANQTEGGNL